MTTSNKESLIKISSTADRNHSKQSQKIWNSTGLGDHPPPMVWVPYPKDVLDQKNEVELWNLHICPAILVLGNENPYWRQNCLQLSKELNYILYFMNTISL